MFTSNLIWGALNSASTAQTWFCARNSSDYLLLAIFCATVGFWAGFACAAFCLCPAFRVAVFRVLAAGCQAAIAPAVTQTAAPPNLSSGARRRLARYVHE